MAKMRVHELAKELGIKSQEIIECLSGTEYETKSANSNIEDAAQEIVRKKYKKADAPKTEEKEQKTQEPKKPKTQENAAEAKATETKAQESKTPEVKAEGTKPVPGANPSSANPLPPYIIIMGCADSPAQPLFSSSL